MPDTQWRDRDPRLRRKPRSALTGRIHTGAFLSYGARMGNRTRSAKVIVACAVVAIAMSACSSSSKPSSSSTSRPASGSSSADFCAKVQNEVDAFRITSFAGKTPGELKSTYSSLAQKLEKLESEAPSAISDDFTTFVTFTKRVQAVLADANYDPTKLSISDITGLFSSQATTAASHVVQYITQNCHFTTPAS